MRDDPGVASGPRREASVGAVDYTDICVCPTCYGPLTDAGSDGLACETCRMSFELRNGVLVLLPPYDDERQLRYVSSYNDVARDDLITPFEYDRAKRHQTLLDFIGDVRGKRVLDIGSSDAAYLRRLDASSKVALDIALPFLEAIPAETGVIRVCGDAETLPFRSGAFDVIVVSDVLEHLLQPEHLVARLRKVATHGTRVIVHIPWREDIAKYSQSPYEFTHLRSFDDYSFALLWRGFGTRRERGTHPSLEEPVVFHLRRFLPLRIYDNLVRYYFTRLGGREYQWRAKWIANLPRHERLLLLVYPPKFKMFELRLWNTELRRYRLARRLLRGRR
jgi:SAM-dependent methyltransferase